MHSMTYDYLIVGAGFAGCVLAERLAAELGKRVLVVDRRSHIGGNAFDEKDSHGVLVHKYGPHIFHTNDDRIVRYLSRFTEWRPYEHRVKANVHGIQVPIPINRTTVNLLFGLRCTSDADVEAFFLQERANRREIQNSEDVVVSKVGYRLFHLLYEGYTRKQWGMEPRELAPSVCGRIPVRTNEDDRYFDDRFQLMPSEGYTAMFRRMIAHPLIELRLNTDYRNCQAEHFNRLVFTGPIDEFFDKIHGPLPYRSLRFEYRSFEQELVQPVASINYPDDEEFTRTTEFKHMTGQRHPWTTIAVEYPQADGDPYYPVPQRANLERYERYRSECLKLKTVHFLGRLASYQYYNMDQVVAQSLKLFGQLATGTAVFSPAAE